MQTKGSALESFGPRGFVPRCAHFSYFHVNFVGTRGRCADSISEPPRVPQHVRSSLESLLTDRRRWNAESNVGDAGVW
ncbi:hypothetical protein B0H17DRAFT_1026936 [Mycena rosella]|uniref:Uncharacterized protein n=1 Tax=Mycena rosella TaxID=1033263 RepID=A0AAD7H1Y1_MYCRO|nr:hypothetical protein B0H17DRAFT_1026936 [Mycena rosella]